MEEELEEVKPIDEDTSSRETIVSGLKENFFVEASAGSGKTTSLVLRMVALVEKKVPVNKICTITFTKAAADEFFSRFQDLLSKRSVLVPDDTDRDLGPKTKESVELCQEALKNIDSCFLGTIDAFCNMIAHELPAELKIPSNTEVINLKEFTAIVLDAHLKVLDDRKHPLHKKALRFDELIDYSTKSLAVGIIAFRDKRHTEISLDHICPNRDMDKCLEKYKCELLTIIGHLVKLTNCYRPGTAKTKEKYQLQGSLKNYNRILCKKNWSECIPVLELAIKTIIKMDEYSSEATKTDIGYLLELKPCKKPNINTPYIYKEKFLERLKEIQWEIDEYKYSIFCDYVLDLSRLLEDEFKNRGKFQFFDYQYYLNTAFKKCGEEGKYQLINHILERHSHFLLDESQDTNPIQTEMFFRLTADIDEGVIAPKDWRELSPREGSLFIVGDPKQSIYSFRDANVSAYLNNKKIFQDDGELLVLTRNFRSNVRLRQWFNNVMNGLLNHSPDPLEHLDIPIDDKEIKGEKIPEDVIDGVYKYSLSEKDDGDYIAKMILSLVEKEKIYSKNEDRTEENKATEPKKKERLIRYSDFMIVPRNTKVDKLIAALKKYHIPMTIEAINPYKDSESLIVMRDLTYLLKAPQETSHFLRVIYGPLYRLNEKDVITLINDDFDLDISHPVDISDEKLDTIIKQLNALYTATCSMSISSTMLYILNNRELNIFDKVSSSYLEYSYFLIQKVKEKEEEEALSSIVQLKELIKDFLKAKDDQRSLRFKEKVDRVKISNVHKVKGLQAPIVVLAIPHTNVYPPTSYVDYSFSTPKTYFTQFSVKNSHDNTVVVAKTNEYKDKIPLWAEHDRAERERLEYVAATRAESVLVVGDVKLDSDEINPWGNLYNKVSDDFNNGNLEVIDLEPPQIDPVNVPLGDFNMKEESHEQTLKYVSPSQLRVNRINNNNDEIDDSEFLDDEKEKQATVLGTLVHRLMELIVSSKNQYDIDSVVLKVKSEYGAFDFEYEELLRKVALTIKKGGYAQKNSSLDDDILKTLMSAKKVWCETPFSYLSKEGNIVNGVIDVMYLDQNDKYHIVDYKTNDEDDVSKLEKEYENQLTSYRYALKKMGIDCDAHIYHIDIK